jgi:hypothetical protein
LRIARLGIPWDRSTLEVRLYPKAKI